MPRVELAIVWHLHQPLYVDPVSGKSVLPWVRLHASRSYYDLARVLPEHPGARVHLNVVPALLDQIELAAQGKARDPWLELTQRRAEDLSPAEREFVLRNFFMVAWETEVRPRPRYWELLQKRGTEKAQLTPAELERTAKQFSTADLRDLQVLFNLAWTGFSLREEDPALAELLTRGSGFREEDKQVVLAAQHRALAAIVPQYRALSDAGQVELTSTPYYHPILPLLIDSDSAREGLPDRPLPQRFAFPQDAREQVARARKRHAELFGRAPDGMWPAEGGVSPAAAAIFASEGTRWIASDEGILWRSLPNGAASDREQLYQPYRLDTEAGPISMVFRDHGLSDRIGFSYSHMPADAAVDDLLAQVQSAATDSAEPPLVSIVLDGENPWEHYPESGRDFLHRLFAELEDPDRGVETVLLGKRLPTHAHRPLARLHAGSWVDANFRIWIGEAEDRTAWEFLRAAREALEHARAAGRPAEDLARAMDHLLVAEGSDWTWWFGGDFATDTPGEFDSLFRNQLLAAYRSIGEAPPRDLLRPISHAALGLNGASGRTEITGLIEPTIDGRVSRHGEWQGAGRVGAEQEGAMHQGTKPFSQSLFGFGTGSLFVRLDPGTASTLPAGWEIEVSLQINGAPSAPLHWKAGSTRSPVTWDPGSGNLPAGSGCFRDIVELELELKPLSLAPGVRFDLAVRVLAGAVELQRFPATGWLDLTVPSPELERQIWKV